MAMYTSSINSATIPNTWAQLDQPTTQELNAETVAESYPTSPLPVVILGAPGTQIWGFSWQENFLLVYDYSKRNTEI